jgi:glyoxylase-like metal-dependent hydrolase (beta-lactamase superfamily II)
MRKKRTQEREKSNSVSPFAMAVKEKNITVAPLYEGTFSVGIDKKFNRIKRTDGPSKGSLKLSINPFLIKTGDRNILFDVGLGEFGEDTSLQTIRDNLAEHGLTEMDITDIFASHLHYDHLGGLAGKPNGYWELTFPDAKLWVSENEWNKLMGLNGATDDEVKIDFIYFLDAKANLHFLKTEDEPYPFIRTKTIGGHTQFSQALFFEDGEHKYLMAGDVIGTKGSINRKYAAKYDFDPQQSMKAREELVKFAYDEGYAIMSYHESDAPIYKPVDFDPQKGYLTENYVSYDFD